MTLKKEQKINSFKKVLWLKNYKIIFLKHFMAIQFVFISQNPTNKNKKAKKNFIFYIKQF